MRMDSAPGAFVAGAAIARGADGARHSALRARSLCGRTLRAPAAQVIRMLEHPNPKFRRIEFQEFQKPPKGFNWDKKYPGTMPPGQAGDNYPLESIEDVWKGVDLTVSSVYDREDEIIEPCVDFLELVANSGKLVSRNHDAGFDEDNFEKVAKKVRAQVQEEDLEFDPRGDEADEFSSFYKDSDDENGMIPSGATEFLEYGGDDERMQLD
ncbi:hypothetical protein FVE85_5201 [Porphyridium purpureum]|uniref:Uncharacterized protein n=1 Tax=Porphyridium purpureum TaxID=35688 RepID=A0A5J4Z1V8_PORPP|nr:hypothetical protein FVE85_5201 [Porphyridium purpureum]|eukprot:POR5052..scf295_1